MIELRVERGPDGEALAPVSRELTAEEVAALVGSIDQVIADECARIDRASDARDALDLQFDFEATPALLMTGQTVAAGVRALQMGAVNITDWQGQQARALAAVLEGNPTAVIKVIVSDNATVLAPAEQFLRCFEAGSQRKEANAIWRVQRKALVRAQTTIAGVAATRAAADAGWP
ncbi:hypothetical protein [Caulobacter sp. RHG1]|uniref:hypothetical protein n=1 Tax=Caulobacter sp. (strain RHG1) TaxID=2545762 RepID=UPI001552E869|nr:hypothetical protein [Caulobacter sp. RHG1]NQE62967.1 hypothetical protein [Caulobacter sp. RHG1]